MATLSEDCFQRKVRDAEREATNYAKPMINQEMIKRLKRYTNFILIKDAILSSAKKYVRYEFVKTGLAQAVAFIMQRLGYPQDAMAKVYRLLLHWDIGPKIEKPKFST